jgi:hypothetical protein
VLLTYEYNVLDVFVEFVGTVDMDLGIVGNPTSRAGSSERKPG